MYRQQGQGMKRTQGYARNVTRGLHIKDAQGMKHVQGTLCPADPDRQLRSRMKLTTLDGKPGHLTNQLALCAGFLGGRLGRALPDEPGESRFSQLSLF